MQTFCGTFESAQQLLLIGQSVGKPQFFAQTAGLPEPCVMQVLPDAQVPLGQESPGWPPELLVPLELAPLELAPLELAPLELPPPPHAAARFVHCDGSGLAKSPHLVSAAWFGQS